MTARVPELLDDALDLVLPLVAESRGTRLLVGITGPPAAGKSTLSVALAAALSDRHAVPAVAVPMDGFHLANAELERLGLTHRKGAPETFDAAGFVHLLRRLRARDDTETVYAPTYSRTVHESIAGAIPVPPHVRVVVVEGNYLLLRRGAWGSVRGLLDRVVYVDAPHHRRHDSLLRRQRARGLDEAAAHAFVTDSDHRNAALIETTRDLADVVLKRS